MTREQLMSLLNKLGVEYHVMEQDGNILKINFWVETKDAAKS